MLLYSFWRNRSGNFALAFAVAFPALIAAIGAVLDVTNIVSARASLQNALDAAILASSRLKDKGKSRDATFQAFFTANISGSQDVTDPVAVLKVEETATAIKSTGTATADVVLNFIWIFGV